MRFSAVIISSLVAFASAAPNAIVVRTSPNTDLIAQNLVFAAQASDCSILKCAEVLANVACIVAALATEEVSAGATTTAVVACVKEGLGEVCECGACIPGLGSFLTTNNVCPSS